MTLLDSLILVTPVVTIGANLTVFFYVFPVFKHTKNRAFLLLGCSALLGIFDTVCDHTIGIDSYRRGYSNWVAYRIVRKFTYMGDAVLMTAGIVLLARGAMNSNQTDTAPPKDRNV